MVKNLISSKSGYGSEKLNLMVQYRFKVSVLVQYTLKVHIE